MIKDLKLLFEQWNRKQLKFEDFSDFIEITTPFVDMHNDYIQLYFTKEKNGKYKLSDDGYIISELSILGVDINTARKRKEYFNNTLKIFGVSFDDQTDELYVIFDSIEEYPKKQHNLLQCITRISDMLLTARNTVAKIFLDEVSSYFEEQNVLFTPNLGFIGKTGNQQTFDFVIPHTKKKKEKLIQTVNSPTADNYTATLFSFIDVQEVRPNSEFIVIANDMNTPIADKFSSSLASYNVATLAWSKKHKWINDLKIV